ncbi:hypothetical protein JZ751_029034 [Albula glossodonta]|uniref:Uncharacterized protein n=1 Tax=Albula glossodonta TaxID=121402 RepID=A0A8T2PIP1_9TELE|nr:hypothetical protein JZ751_029034 [Albula glossodonta]
MSQDSVSSAVCLSLTTSAAHFCSSCTFSASPFPKQKKKLPQARKELRRLKEEARNKHAVSVIWASWQGTKVFGKPAARPSPAIPIYVCP